MAMSGTCMLPVFWNPCGTHMPVFSRDLLRKESGDLSRRRKKAKNKVKKKKQEKDKETQQQR